MGEFLNPDSMAYKRAKNSEIYVDKTGLLKLLNKRINTMNNRVCSTRSRRFGKTIAIDMIAAYYSLGTDLNSPKSIVDAMTYGEYASYWFQTETFEILRDYISMNFDGLKYDVIKMLTGECIDVHTGTFTNDVVSFASRDDVLTALVHLGYLAYDEEECQVYIPNKEVSAEFEKWSKECKTLVDIGMGFLKRKRG